MIGRVSHRVGETEIRGNSTRGATMILSRQKADEKQWTQATLVVLGFVLLVIGVFLAV